MNSLDPRVKRLPEVGDAPPKVLLDQLSTFEVFVQPKAGKPFQHEGIVHAPDIEMAFVLAKESLTRRFLCVSIFVASTKDVFVTEVTEGDKSAYDVVPVVNGLTSGKDKYEVFHLLKRGKQHVHAGTVEADSMEDAFAHAKVKFGNTRVFNIWIIPQSKIRYTSPEEADLWNTLPEKKFRDASNYKGGDKLKEFLSRA